MTSLQVHLLLLDGIPNSPGEWLGVTVYRREVDGGYKVVSKPYQPEAFLLFKEMPFAPPDNVVNSLHFGFKSLATIWARAA